MTFDGIKFVNNKMKKLVGIIFFFYSTLVISQVQPSVTYDPETGNYIIKYEGYEGDNE